MRETTDNFRANRFPESKGDLFHVMWVFRTVLLSAQNERNKKVVVFFSGRRILAPLRWGCSNYISPCLKKSNGMTSTENPSWTLAISQ